MKITGTLKVTTPTEREVVMTRVFDAPRRLVFDALTKPELFKRWFRDASPCIVPVPGRSQPCRGSYGSPSHC
jgi:uncharacterized protein YndB with AHSA1/START domain